MAQRDWVIEHMDRYKATGGEEGHIWKGVDGKQSLPCLILTTTGRRSGKQFETALIYGKDGDNYVIVASVGGAPKHPLWYETWRPIRRSSCRSWRTSSLPTRAPPPARSAPGCGP